MVHKYIKIFLLVVFLFLSIYLFWDRQSGLGSLFAILSFLLAFFYFRNEYLLMAFFAMRKQNVDKSKKWLDKIKNPKSRLIRSQEAYYYFLNGNIAMQNSLSKGEQFFRKALKVGLFMNHDKAMAKMNLAVIAMAKGKKNEANKLLSEAKILDKRGMLTDQLKMVKNQMKKASISRNPQMQRMQRKGRAF